MSAIHDVQDIGELSGPVFFKLAYRLPAYEGAVRLDLDGWLTEAQESEQEAEIAKFPPRYLEPGEEDQPMSFYEESPSRGRTSTLEELVAAGPPMPQFGENVPIFEIARPTD